MFLVTWPVGGLGYEAGSKEDHGHRGIPQRVPPRGGQVDDGVGGCEAIRMDQTRGAKQHAAQTPLAGGFEAAAGGVERRRPVDDFLCRLHLQQPFEVAAGDEVAALLPMGAHALRVDIDRDSGLSAFNVLTTRAGATMVLVSTQALKTTSMAEISTFIGNKCELISLSAEDSAIGAGAMLCVHGNVFVPPGVSTTLRGHLWRFGFQVVDVDVSELGGAAIGLGPRAFALPWSQCMLDDALPTYATRRDELYRRLDEYAAK